MKVSHVVIAALLCLALLAFSVVLVSAQDEPKKPAQTQIAKPVPEKPAGPKQRFKERFGKPGQGPQQGQRPRTLFRPRPLEPVVAVYGDGYVFVIRGNMIYKINAQTMVKEAELQYAEVLRPGPPMGPPGQGLGPPGEGLPFKPGPGKPPVEKPRKPAKE